MPPVGGVRGLVGPLYLIGILRQGHNKDWEICRKSLTAKELGRGGRPLMVVSLLLPTGYVNCFGVNKKGRNRSMIHPVTAKYQSRCSSCESFHI